MKIPETNIYCTFHTQKLPIDKVPYWRLYIIRKERIRNEYGVKTIRTVANRLMCNYNIDDIHKIIKQLGPAKIARYTDKNVKYCYEAYPRNTKYNTLFDK